MTRFNLGLFSRSDPVRKRAYLLPAASAAFLALASTSASADSQARYTERYGEPIAHTHASGADQWIYARTTPCLSIAGGRSCVHDPYLVGSTENWRLEIGPSGAVLGFAPALTPAELALITPGVTTRADVVRQFGPAAREGMAAEGVTDLHYILVNGAIRLPAVFRVDADGRVVQVKVGRPVTALAGPVRLGHP